MNRESNNNVIASVERAKECIYDRFEQAWHQDPGYRVEDHIPLISSIAHQFEVDGEKADFKIPVVAELIRIEISLRRGANENAFRFEYERRFPELEPFFHEAFDDSNSRDVVATVTQVSGMRTDDLAQSQPDDRNEKVPGELGPFKQIVKIGSGGFGVVCRAIDSRVEKPVALKFPRKKVLASKEKLDLFLTEADRVIKLDHPGIVKIYSIEHIDGHPVIVMQLVAGSDLKQTITEQRNQQEIAELIASVADALEYAHLQGIIHRDLKPANILLDGNGRPHVVDFGLAINEEEQFCAPNQICGTVPYMSAQLAAGLTRNLDGRTDIWSLGVILYELLVGKRPFRGLTPADILYDIETKDPKPPRQYDNEISKELQRICLRCLEKKAKDRYSSADELANDLRHWMRAGDKTAKKRVMDFVPKGLRSFDASDSEFFLDLLPGPRDRDDIPVSIRFWTSRIREPVPEENRIPVGVIYGPSGSGKSSFVKAGLLPRLKRDLFTVYVESTQADTEVRLLNRLRDNFKEIPKDVDIPEIFRGLSQGRWRSSDRKILIVLDQFEQRLSKADDFDQSQLAKALRHCDGERLQCLLLIRDDFWLALTRFFDALEMDLLEGQNSQSIDLFDRDHSRKVLIKLGRVYGCLPVEPDKLSDDQNRFVDTAVEQLSIGNYIICVRLTLFAEMFKSRSWNLEELKSVGGVRGLGERFLAQTFGDESPSRRYQLQGKEAKSVLEALLPDSGSNIRGSMRHEPELIKQAKLENRPDKFKDLIKTLDQDLRLITRTDPDDAGEATGSDHPLKHQVSDHYQLTHDYLVPSIRNWLNSESRKTRRGRVRMRVRESAKDWSINQKSSYLPSLPEFFYMAPFLPFDSINEMERKYLLRAFVVNGIRLAVWTTILTAVLLIWFGFQSNRLRELTKSHVDLFLNCRPESVPVAIELLKQNQSGAVELLQEIKNQPNNDQTDSSQINRINLGLSLLIPGNLAALQPLLDSVEEMDAAECNNVLQALEDAAENAERLVVEHRSTATSSVGKTRWNIINLFLYPEAGDHGFKLSHNPDFRTRQIFALDDWHGDEADFDSVLNSLTDKDAKSAFLIAIGRRAKTDFGTATQRSIAKAAKRMFATDPGSDVHSASRWMLTQWGETLPSLAENSANRWIVNSLGMTLVKINAGDVIIARGSQHPTIKETLVKLESPFFVTDKEVSIENYAAFQSETGYRVKFSEKFEASNPSTLPEHPVTSITLEDIVEFCNWLSAKEGFTPCYQATEEQLEAFDEMFDNNPEGNLWTLNPNGNGYRLPTYAEWEHTASGGASTEYFFGSAKLAKRLSEFAWYTENSKFDGNTVKRKCGVKLPNQYGLFDASGNVFEICWDSPFEGIALDRSRSRFVRGGSIHSASQDCMTGEFELMPVTTPNSTIGFRLVRSVD